MIIQVLPNAQVGFITIADSQVNLYPETQRQLNLLKAVDIDEVKKELGLDVYFFSNKKHHRICIICNGNKQAERKAQLFFMKLIQSYNLKQKYLYGHLNKNHKVI